jgi:predicted transcriptional regulator
MNHPNLRTSADTTETVVGQIAAAYLGNNPTHKEDIKSVILDIRRALEADLDELDAPQQEEPQHSDTYRFGAPSLTGRPARQLNPREIAASYANPNYIVCFEDDAQVVSLKRHLSTKYGMTPDQYRQKWGLDRSYPMIASGPQEQMRQRAYARGLGQKPKEAPAAPPPPPVAKGKARGSTAATA